MDRPSHVGIRGLQILKTVGFLEIIANCSYPTFYHKPFLCIYPIN